MEIKDIIKKLLLSALLLILTNNSDAIDANIVLPSQQELDSRLRSLDLGHFLEKTAIDATLGGKQKHPMGVFMTVETALLAYNKVEPDQLIVDQVQMMKPVIIEAILKDHPQAIEFLKQKNLLK